MERRKAMWAATAAALALVASSMAYAATNLLAPQPADHVGELAATAPRPVEYVYDEVAAPAPPDSATGAELSDDVSGQTPAPPAVFTDDDANHDDERDDAYEHESTPAPVSATPSETIAPNATTTTTLRAEDDDREDDHSSDEYEYEDSHDRDGDDD